MLLFTTPLLLLLVLVLGSNLLLVALGSSTSAGPLLPPLGAYKGPSSPCPGKSGSSASADCPELECSSVPAVAASFGHVVQAGCCCKLGK
jgi:hypothetical protein